MILIKNANVTGDSQITGYEKCFAVTSFSFGSERELKDSGKAGTADINIGMVDLQEISCSKSMDVSSYMLARKAISGSSIGNTDVFFVQTIEESNNRKNVCYLQFKLHNTFIKTWSISGSEDERPDESFTMWYNKVAFVYFTSPDGVKYELAGEAKWDKVSQKMWDDHGIPTKATVTSAE